MMKMLLMVECPNEPFNSLVKAGKVGEVIERILESIKPEAAYFTEQDGRRGGIFLVDVQDSSDIPAFAEPFFHQLQRHLQIPHRAEPRGSAKGRSANARAKVGNASRLSHNTTHVAAAEGCVRLRSSRKP